ncbi:MAG TPA: PPC domain-containing protein, partial [Chthoniobacterales bacterium]
ISEPPGNDIFASATVVPNNGGILTGTNAGATNESGEPNHAGYPGGRSVWWKWTSPSTGSVTISTSGSAFDTLLGVYTGNAVNALTLVASDNNSNGLLTSAVRFATTGGTTYFIAVDGYNAASGNVRLVVTPSSNAPVRPVNDSFLSAITLNGVSVTSIISSDYATLEPGEPVHANVAGGKSIWWSWTAPSSGPATASTSGSNFDTVLGVYTGSTVDDLTLVGNNNDYAGSRTSQVAFTATAGVTYVIAVDGNGGSSGTVRMNVTGYAPPPPNDNFANAILLPSVSTSVSSNNLSATKETGEPNHAGNSGGKSVWWRWTAPADGQVTINTIGSNFDTTLGIYTGSAVNALTLIAGDDDSGGNQASKITFNAFAGTTYQIAVDGFSGGAGAIVLNVVLPQPPPANDNFSGAFVLSGEAPVASGSNSNATKEAGEPAHAGSTGGHSVWWRWTAPTSGYASVSTAGSDFDTLLAVYTGTQVSALTEIASNDQANGTDQSQVVFAVTAGVEYRIAVDGWFGAQGNVSVAINGPLPPPQGYVTTSVDSASEQTGEQALFYVLTYPPQAHPVTVHVYLDGTAIPGVDYTIDSPLDGRVATVVVPAGSYYTFVLVTPITDQDATEFDETIIPTLMADPAYEIQEGTAATITLHDNSPYNSTWAQQFPGFVGPATDPLADFNGNGVVNLLEFAFNGDPVAGNFTRDGVPLLPVISLGLYADSDDGNLEKIFPIITFNRRTDAAWLTYVVQTSTALALAPWDSNGAIQVSATSAGMPAGIERVTYRSIHPAQGANRVTPQFLRVQVTAAPH